MTMGGFFYAAKASSTTFTKHIHTPRHRQTELGDLNMGVFSESFLVRNLTQQFKKIQICAIQVQVNHGEFPTLLLAMSPDIGVAREEKELCSIHHVMSLGYVPTQAPFFGLKSVRRSSFPSLGRYPSPII